MTLHSSSLACCGLPFNQINTFLLLTTNNYTVTPPTISLVSVPAQLHQITSCSLTLRHKCLHKQLELLGYQLQQFDTNHLSRIVDKINSYSSLACMCMHFARISFLNLILVLLHVYTSPKLYFKLNAKMHVHLYHA